MARRRSRSNSLVPDDKNHSRSRSGSIISTNEKLSRDRKRSMSLVSSMLLSAGHHEGLYSPNELKSRSRVDLLRHENYTNDNLKSRSNPSSPKRVRKPRSNSVGPNELLYELRLAENRSNSSLCLIDLNCEI